MPSSASPKVKLVGAFVSAICIAPQATQQHQGCAGMPERQYQLEVPVSLTDTSCPGFPGQVHWRLCIGARQPSLQKLEREHCGRRALCFSGREGHQAGPFERQGVGCCGAHMGGASADCFWKGT